jgi:hypothetical protein
MRSPAFSLLLVLCLFAPAAGPLSADQSAQRTLLARVEFQPRTSLTVSSSVLQFQQNDPDTTAVVTVDFTARARTGHAGEVVLTVESAHGIEGPGGASDIEAVVSFAGEGGGTRAGVLGTGGPSVAGRWVGSGSRDGRIAFTLRASAPGTYTVPLRFVLSAP